MSGPLGLRKPGGCTTITLPIENVTDFLAGHLASDHQLITAKLWPDIASKLEAPGRWSRVFGPLSSAIATLQDFDWVVPLDLSAPNLIQMLKELLQHFFQASLWKKLVFSLRVLPLT